MLCLSTIMTMMLVMVVNNDVDDSAAALRHDTAKNRITCIGPTLPMP